MVGGTQLKDLFPPFDGIYIYLLASFERILRQVQGGALIERSIRAETQRLRSDKAFDEFFAAVYGAKRQICVEPS
jgi:hypothetical protein